MNSVLLNESLYLTDGGMETSLIFQKGFTLPLFAACSLLQNEKGYQALQMYYTSYMNMAKRFQTGFILESATWRASPDWIKALGYNSPTALKELNSKAIQLIKNLKKEFESQLKCPIIISGCIGPRGDGYKINSKMDAITSQQYHSAQISLFKELGGIDVVSAYTLNYVEEAIGIVNACNQVQLPCVISFTLETNGILPSGMSLKEAIETVDSNTSQSPLYYMINCAHPSHFLSVLEEAKQSNWIKRIKGVRGNASCKSHAELDESTELDRGNVDDFGMLYKKIKQLCPHMNVFGGCCGTDEQHVEAIFTNL